MKELNSTETQSVNGGAAPLLYAGYIGGAYALGWIGGYVKEKYDQYKEKQQKESEQ